MFCCEDVQNCDEMFSTPGTLKKISPLTPGQGQTDPLTPGRLGQPMEDTKIAIFQKGDIKKHADIDWRGEGVRYSTVQGTVRYSTRYREKIPPDPGYTGPGQGTIPYLH